MSLPAFIITIDAEGDNLWKNQKGIIKTQNVYFLSRFQSLCERFNFKSVWLTSYEMAKETVFVEFAKDIIARRKGEIGMHLHAWNTPPEYSLTNDNCLYQTYLIEFPYKIMREKITFMTHFLEEVFNEKMLSHRAGRWALDSRYAKLLIEFGYQVDCSVTPRINWKNVKGIPHGIGGTDYQHFPDYAYFIDVNDISKPGNSLLLEVPMSIHYKHPMWINIIKKVYDRLRRKYRSPSVNWIRPSINNIKEMISVAKKYFLQGSDYFEFMIHSSELMPNGSPTFKNESEIEELYENLEILFTWFSKNSKGMTLTEYYQKKRMIFQKN